MVNNSGAIAQLWKYTTSGRWNKKPPSINDGDNDMAEVYYACYMYQCYIYNIIIELISTSDFMLYCILYHASLMKSSLYFVYRQSVLEFR